MAESAHVESDQRPRVFISYAHESPEHQEAVRDLWVLLRALGIDARLDLPAAERRQDWPLWMLRELRAADFVLVIASPAYRRRAEGDAEPAEGRGVQFEAALIREEVYGDRDEATARFLPVLLPGASPDDIPAFLGATTATSYSVSEFTLAGVERLVRVITGQRWEVEPALGELVTLPSRTQSLPASALALPGLAHELVLQVFCETGQIRCRVLLAGTLLGERESELPSELAHAWEALASSSAAADQALAERGRRLASALVDDATAARLAELVDRSPIGTAVEVVVEADGAALALPYELLRLPDGRLLATLAGVRMRRRIRGVERSACPPMAGPLKVLVAVAAPEETRTSSPPLDIEAEMQAILDAVGGVEGAGRAQVTFLEVAGPQQITEALRADPYHVVHLSAHGSATSVELEDEDGNPQLVAAHELVERLRAGGRSVPLIVLSSCAGAAAGSEALAATLVTRGADRVLAMQAPVTDRYATGLARELYERLADRETAPSVGAALAGARRRLEEQRLSAARAGQPSAAPEYGVATLLSADSDPPLLDAAAPSVELRHPTLVPAGTTVRQLRIGDLIGRRRPLRTALKALRGGPDARDEWGALSGVLFVGIGGIGKTALAGRTMTRLAAEGWLTAVHDGPWSPQALITAVTGALAHPAAADLDDIRGALGDDALDDSSKVELIFTMLEQRRVLLVFDDFEQNLEPDGAFRDPGFGELFETLCIRCGQGTGRVLVTSRYAPVRVEQFLLAITVPSLSPAELRRLLFRMPALRRLDADDRRLVAATIGGHPRLIEFVDALLRGGRGNLTEVTARLRSLANEHGVAVSRDRALRDVIPDAVLLGSRDILLDELLALLDEQQREVLLQAAVSILPLSHDDLAVARYGAEPSTEQRRDVRAATQRLLELTLLSPTSNSEDEVTVHRWVAEALTEHQGEGESLRHDRALSMRMARVEAGRGGLEDLVEVCRHLAATSQFDDLVTLAFGAAEMLGRQAGVLSVSAFLGEIVPLVPEDTPNYVYLVDREQRALVLIGSPSAALKRAEHVIRVAEAGAERDPTSAAAQRDVSFAHTSLGELWITLGDSEQADRHYRQALTIDERLAAADPANAQAQRDLSVSHDKLGDLARERGDSDQADRHYRQALTIDERLAAADPSGAQAQRDLSISHERLGDLAHQRGDSEQADRHYRQALTIRERLAAADPANAQAHRDLSISHNNLGDLAQQRGDSEQADRHYRQALTIAERLAAADPTNAQAQRDLSISHDKLGDLARERGDSEQADRHYRQALTITERLAAADPTNAQAHRDLSVTRNKLGDLARERGDSEQADRHYRQALTIAERLAAADPASAEAQRDLSVSHDKLGNRARERGDNEQADRHLRQALTIAERLAAADPANAQAQRDLSISHDNLGDLAHQRGDSEQAERHLRQALTIRERLAAADPANTQAQRDLSISHERLDDLARQRGATE